MARTPQPTMTAAAYVARYYPGCTCRWEWTQMPRQNNYVRLAPWCWLPVARTPGCPRHDATGEV